MEILGTKKGGSGIGHRASPRRGTQWVRDSREGVGGKDSIENDTKYSKKPTFELGGSRFVKEKETSCKKPREAEKKEKIVSHGSISMRAIGRPIVMPKGKTHRLHHLSG